MFECSIVGQFGSAQQVRRFAGSRVRRFDSSRLTVRWLDSSMARQFDGLRVFEGIRGCAIVGVLEPVGAESGKVGSAEKVRPARGKGSQRGSWSTRGTSPPGKLLTATRQDLSFLQTEMD